MALVVEDDGTRYSGSQLHADRPTVQQALELALERLTGESVRISAAGRTDAGVHALGQVIGFSVNSALSPEAYVGGMNHYLPDDVAVKAASVVEDSFDPRRDAVSREYRYTIFNGPTRSPIRQRFAYRVAGNLDVAAMNRACRDMVGEHDFASFASDVAGETGSTVRRVYRAGVRREADEVLFDIEANAFVRHQIRSTVGCLVRIGLDKMTPEDLRGIMDARTPGMAGPTLPANGLCLVRVNYPRTGVHPHSLEDRQDD
jgi:tRNA pseudouridine38-40 synthase